MEEKQHLEHCLNIIDAKMKELLLQEKGFKEMLSPLRKTFWNDVRVNLDTAEDVDETFFAIKQQVELLSDSELAQQRAIRNVKVYERLQQSPYFARIDFLQSEHSEPLKIYIGVATLLDEQDENIIIYDWRAPISVCIMIALLVKLPTKLQRRIFTVRCCLNGNLLLKMVSYNPCLIQA